MPESQSSNLSALRLVSDALVRALHRDKQELATDFQVGRNQREDRGAFLLGGSQRASFLSLWRQSIVDRLALLNENKRVLSVN